MPAVGPNEKGLETSPFPLRQWRCPYWGALLLPDEEPPCCCTGSFVELLLPLPDVLLPEALFWLLPWLRVETVPVVSGCVERWRLVETFVLLELVSLELRTVLRRCSTDTPTDGDVSRDWRIVVRRLTDTLGSLTSS